MGPALTLRTATSITGRVLTAATPRRPCAHDVSTREEPAVTTIRRDPPQIRNCAKMTCGFARPLEGMGLARDGRDASLVHLPGGRPVVPRATP
jgi:hypothetical protein